MKCRICNREAVNEYCDLHEKAYKSIVQKFDVWKKALGISWKEYLNEIAKNPYTGSWAKELAEQIVKSEE